MSQFTSSGKRISARHHASTQSYLQSSKTPSLLPSLNDGENLSPQNLPPSLTQSYYNPEPSTYPDDNIDPTLDDNIETTLDNNNETNGEDNSSATINLMNRILLLESELLTECEHNARLTATMEMERHSFASRLERLEASMSRAPTTLYSAPPLKRAKTPPPSKIPPKPRLTPEQREKISINCVAALQLRNQKLVARSPMYTTPPRLSTTTKSTGPRPPPYPPPPLHTTFISINYLNSDIIFWSAHYNWSCPCYYT